jgi:hypothetical protein
VHRQSFALILCLLLPLKALGACPKTPKDWQKQAPAWLISIAAKQAPLQLEDFSSKLGKAARGRARPYAKNRKERFALVEVEDTESSVFLSGVMKCDPKSGKTSLLSLAWVKGGRSGLLSGPFNSGE